jgi:S-adenosylmethionine/arginine decarboxylase-like enzyme
MVEHKHMLIRADVNKPLVDVEVTKDWLLRLVKAIGMKVCKSGGPHVDYVEAEGNCGIAGMVMIETSHVSVHCWDKQNPPLAQIDIYSCAVYDPDVVLEFVRELEPSFMDYLIVDRKSRLKIESESVFI